MSERRVNEDSISYHDADGRYHRENDLPAIEWNSGSKEWFVNGLRHREGDLPAIVRTPPACPAELHQEWFKNDLRHRDNDQPALSNEYVKEWWVNGLRHRENDKPAIHYIEDNELHWFENGHYHRLNGPAIICDDGSKMYFYHDEHIDVETDEDFQKIVKLKHFL